MQGHRDVVIRLLSSGADLNAEHNDGRTALDMAEEYGHQEVVEVLKN